jgi:hypothetical protein
VASFWSPANVKRLQALVQPGRLILSVEDAAQLLGTTSGIVLAEFKRRYHVPLAKRGEHWTRQRLSKLNLLVNAQGKLIVSCKNAAILLGCPTTSITQGLLQLSKPASHRAPVLVKTPPTMPDTRDLAALFKIDAAGAERLLQRHPRFLRKSAADLRSKMEALADALSLPLDSIAKAVRRKPNIIRLSPAHIGATCAGIADVLDVKPVVVAVAFIQNPSLLQVKAETIAANLADAARLLRCNKAQLAAAFLSRPALLTMRPAFIAKRLRDVGRILGCGHARMLELVLAYPYLLTFATETTALKAKLLVKLSQAVGRNDTPAEVLRLVPMAFSYSKARIEQRVELAHSGRGPRSIGSLLHMTDTKAEELMSPS